MSPAISPHILSIRMRRIFTFFYRREVRQPACAWTMTDVQRQELLRVLSEIGLDIVREANAPVPLLTFGRRVLRRLQCDGVDAIPLPEFADALKRVLREMQHEQLQVMSPTEMLGVGYVYNITERETWPVRSGR